MPLKLIVARTTDAKFSAKDNLSMLMMRNSAEYESPQASKIYLSQTDHPNSKTQQVDNILTTKVVFSVMKIVEVKEKVDRAKISHKIFFAQGYPTIRQAMLKRGWVEKYERPESFDFILSQNSLNKKELTLAELGQRLPALQPGECAEEYNRNCSVIITNRLLENYTVDFYWGSLRSGSPLTTSYQYVIRNRLEVVPFITKEGLNRILRDSHWQRESGVSNVNFPRCYNLKEPTEFESFHRDFRLTACASFLKYTLNKVGEKGAEQMVFVNGEIPLYILNFAIKRCKGYIMPRKHEFIESRVKIPKFNCEWSEFMKQHQALLRKNYVFRKDCKFKFSDLLIEARQALAEMRNFCPQMEIDGLFNMWIMKPVNNCKGRGIILVNNIKDVIQKEKSLGRIDKDGGKIDYVVQKYIERPLIIMQTKFDIRQWFLVTSTTPLIVWMYQDCYLRFSSRGFDLQNYHESVHITNHAVQRKYRNDKLSSSVSRENMWDSTTFQEYLKRSHKKATWTNVIQAGMREAIIGVMLASQEHMVDRDNSFELFGADFMLDKRCTPWLIEINGNPDMRPTTSVTEKMCTECMESVLDIVLDHDLTDTKNMVGKFKCIYHQSLIGNSQNNSSGKLAVEGSSYCLKTPTSVPCIANQNITKSEQNTKKGSNDKQSSDKIIIYRNIQIKKEKGTKFKLKSRSV